jgi:hypothetical protein
MILYSILHFIQTQSPEQVLSKRQLLQTMRAGDATQRRRISQHSALPTTAQAGAFESSPGKRRRKREIISPTFLLTVVMVGTCLVFVIGSRIVKSGRTKQAARRDVSQDVGSTDTPLPAIGETQPLSTENPAQHVADLDITTTAPDGLVDGPAKAAIHQGDKDDDSSLVTTPTASPEQNVQTPVLALLYPPGLMGGYRNQVIRLLSLILMAANRSIHKLLLPSLLWTTQVMLGGGVETWVPIPHDLIFDVEHWNTYVSSGVLPELVEETPSQQLDCWTHDFPPAPSNATRLTREVLKRGFLTPLANLSRSLVTREFVTNLRRLDVLPNVTSTTTTTPRCRNPQVYGGGTGAGRLWRDYINVQNKKNGSSHPHKIVAANVLKALRPKQIWRDLAQSCVVDATTKGSNKLDYIALHARMELEMMDHACGVSMQRNLTRLFEHVEVLAHDMEGVGGVFVAVSRSGIEIREGNLYQKYKAFADENLATLNRVVGDNHGSVGQGLGTEAVVFECGKHLMDKYYSANPNSIDYGSLLQSVVNFYIATEAKAFIGVRGSSYSTDIWTTRFHQGNGATNYEYTKDGIIKLDNGGLPPMHTNCGTKTKKKPS